MELATTEKRGHSENGTGCKQIPSPLGSQSPFTVAARGSLLEASLPGLWSPRSQSVLLTDAHDFAEGAAGLCHSWL